MKKFKKLTKKQWINIFLYTANALCIVSFIAEENWFAAIWCGVATLWYYTTTLSQKIADSWKELMNHYKDCCEHQQAIIEEHINKHTTTREIKVCNLTIQ